MRDYYVSREIIENVINEDSTVECYVQTKDSCNIIALTSVVEKTDSEVGRHDLAILYKTATLNGHTFQLGFDFVDYGAGGLEYGDGENLTQANRRKLITNDSVLIYGLSEVKDKNTIFHKVDVLADDTGELSEIDTVTAKVDIEAVIEGLKAGDLVILPVNKENIRHAGVVWSKNSEDIFRFHSEYVPEYYSEISYILRDKVTVPKDFILYDFFVMSRIVDTDTNGNKWVSLSYDCCLNTLDLIELDKTGKTHMYILDNFKDIDKQEIYNSFMTLNKDDMTFDTILRVIEKVQPESTKWVEDYIVEKVGKHYLSSDYIDVIVKYVRVAKKSKDKDVERFIDMMLHYDGYVHMEGYVRILKALKLKETELNEYVQRVIYEDKKANNSGRNASSFIENWKTGSFKELEDYLYEGIKTQEICEPFKNCNHKTDEERQRRGLNTDYDFVDNYLDILRVKGVDKVNLLERYAQGMSEDAIRFPSSVLLRRLQDYINYNKKDDLSEVIPLFAKYIIEYDRYGEYATKYLPKEKQEEALGYSYSRYSYYRPEFEPYIDALSTVAKEGKKKKSDDEWQERKKRMDAEHEERFKKMMEERRK